VINISNGVCDDFGVPLLHSVGLSSVHIGLGYGMDDRGCRVRFPAGAGNFSLHHRVQNGSGAHSVSYPIGTAGGGALSLGVKRPGREADHSPPYSAEVKNAWNYTSTPQYAFMAWCLVKAQEQLYLYLTFLFHSVGLGSLEHWNHRFEPYSRHGSMSASCCVELSYTGRGVSMG
jgi:hypothetical protein